MHDLKYFSRNRKIFTFFSKRNNKPRNTFRISGNSKQKQKRLRVILPVLAVLLAIYPLAFAIKSFIPKVTKFLHHKSVSAAAFKCRVRFKSSISCCLSVVRFCPRAR